MLTDSLKIYYRCESVLGEFLQNIIENPKKVDFNAMVNLLTVHANSTGVYILYFMYIVYRYNELLPHLKQS